MPTATYVCIGSRYEGTYRLCHSSVGTKYEGVTVSVFGALYIRVFGSSYIFPDYSKDHSAPDHCGTRRVSLWANCITSCALLSSRDEIWTTGPLWCLPSPPTFFLSCFFLPGLQPVYFSLHSLLATCLVQHQQTVCHNQLSSSAA